MIFPVTLEEYKTVEVRGFEVKLARQPSNPEKLYAFRDKSPKFLVDALNSTEAAVIARADSILETYISFTESKPNS